MLVPLGHKTFLDARQDLTMFGTCGNGGANHSLGYGKSIASTEQVGFEYGS